MKVLRNLSDSRPLSVSALQTLEVDLECGSNTYLTVDRDSSLLVAYGIVARLNRCRGLHLSKVKNGSKIKGLI